MCCLPYMILTLYAAMRGIDVSLLRAAEGLGASGIYTFWRVYFPLSMHGVLSGALIVYILSVGYFITPALMGGQHDIMIAMLIDRSLEVAVDWPSAALMSLILLLVTLGLYAVYYRVTDIRRLIEGALTGATLEFQSASRLCRCNVHLDAGADCHRRDSGLQW